VRSPSPCRTYLSAMVTMGGAHQRAVALYRRSRRYGRRSSPGARPRAVWMPPGMGRSPRRSGERWTAAGSATMRRSRSRRTSERAPTPCRGTGSASAIPTDARCSERERGSRPSVGARASSQDPVWCSRIALQTIALAARRPPSAAARSSRAPDRAAAEAVCRIGRSTWSNHP
jgi:hypothetical protein